MYTYSQLDRRVHALGLIVKYWVCSQCCSARLQRVARRELQAKFANIGDAAKGSLSSYAYLLCMIHYLQVTVRAPPFRELYPTFDIVPAN